MSEFITKFLTKLKSYNFYRRKKFWYWAAPIILIVGLILRSSFKTVPPELSTVLVQKMDLPQTVAETGSIKAEIELKYGFEQGGKVIEIKKKAGDKVKAGELVARLENGRERARVAEASSWLASAQASLNLKLAPPSDATAQKALSSVANAKAAMIEAEANINKTIASSDQAIADAQKALTTAQNNLSQASAGEESAIIGDAYANLNNVMHSALTTLTTALNASDDILGVDNVMGNDEFETVLGARDQNSILKARESYFLAKSKLNSLSQLVVAATSHTLADQAALSGSAALSVMQTHLADVEKVLVATIPAGNLSVSELQTLKSSISAVHSSTDASATSLTSSRQAVATARNTLSTANAVYTNATSALENAKQQAIGNVAIAKAEAEAKTAAFAEAEANYTSVVNIPRAVELAPLYADINRYRANVAATVADLRKTELTALADGVIAKLDIDVGENASVGTPVLTIISPTLGVEVDISESDVAKVSLNDEASLTVDAFGDEVKFAGRVVSIEPGETEVSCVVYYKTKIIFATSTNGIVATNNISYPVRSGMTASVKISTDLHLQVLVVPGRAVIEKDGHKIVRVVTDKKAGKFVERTVTVGLSGDDGLLEITSGLSENEEVVTFVKEKK